MGSINKIDHFMTAVEAEQYLSKVGRQDDINIDLFETALAFALSDRFDADIQKYRQKFCELQDLLVHQFNKLCAVHNSDGPDIMAQALKQTLIEIHGFSGDTNDYDNLKNINMMDVIDRRKGIPITLSLLAIALSRGLGWCARGINFPGHFLMRLSKEGDQIIIDPFQSFQVLEAKDLRLILKKTMGDKAELSAQYYEPCSNRDSLLRLQNNIKYRLIDREDYQDALKVVMQMSLIAPDDCRLSLDKAVLFSKIGQTFAAIENIQYYIEHVDDPYDRAEAQEFLQQLQRQLN